MDDVRKEFEKVREHFLDYIETAYLVDIKCQPISVVAEKVETSIISFSNHFYEEGKKSLQSELTTLKTENERLREVFLKLKSSYDYLTAIGRPTPNSQMEGIMTTLTGIVKMYEEAQLNKEPIKSKACLKCSEDCKDSPVCKKGDGRCG